MKLKRRKPKRSGIQDIKRKCRSHQQWVRGFPCSVAEHGGCWGKIVFAHTRGGTDGGMGLKPGDWWGIPLCWGHHVEQGDIGERRFQTKYGIDMKALAEQHAKDSSVQEVREMAGRKL